MLMEPTSLNGGEGLVTCLKVEVGSEVGGSEGEGKGSGGGGRQENEQTSTVMWLMYNSNFARPHR